MTDVKSKKKTVSVSENLGWYTCYLLVMTLNKLVWQWHCRGMHSNIRVPTSLYCYPGTKLICVNLQTHDKQKVLVALGKEHLPQW